MKRILLLFTIISFAINLSAQPLKMVRPESVGLSKNHLKYADKTIERAIAEGYIPGAVLAIVKDGSMPYLKAYGNRTLLPTATPMREDTIFDMASCTKSIVTSISLMRLLERGELSLNDNLDLYIPDFNKDRSFGGKPCSVKIINLLTHTSGLVPYVPAELLEQRLGWADKERLIEYVKSASQRFECGAEFQYGCVNFIILQYIIEQITGVSLQEYASENIFKPLGMHRTGYLPLGGKSGEDAWAKASEIAPSETMADGVSLCGVVHDPMARLICGGVSGNAGLFSSASDLALLSAALLGDGSYRSNRILRELTLKTMISPPKQLEISSRALGWDVSSCFSSNMGDMISGEIFGHSGFTGTSITIDKEKKIAIILLTNAIHAPGYDPGRVSQLRAAVANVVFSAMDMGK
ncbi:MAG: serine hydrolase [Rikenellaceae bacterium]